MSGSDQLASRVLGKWLRRWTCETFPFDYNRQNRNASLENQAAMNDIVLLEIYHKTIRLWWVIVLATVIGGALGLLFSRINPPEYEATAILSATADISNLESISSSEDLIQYNEDLAMYSVHTALISNDVTRALAQKVTENGMSINEERLLLDTVIERKHAFWELRYRNVDPEVAMFVANQWAELGYGQLTAWQQDNKVPQYIEFFPPTLATLPEEPVRYGVYQSMMAGAVLGVLAGILLVNILGSRTRG